MGACVSTPIGGRYGAPSYLAISELSCDTSLYEGQSESKKNGKHGLAVHRPPTATAHSAITTTSATKGSMSFGFKKNNKSTTTTTQKQQDKAANKREYAKIPTDTNGNSDSLASLQADEAMGGSKLTSRLVAPRKEQSGQSYRSNRFGFRQSNVVRPSSTGLQPKVSEFEDPNNNNLIDVKPRSKSALGRATSTSSSDRLNNNCTAVRQNTIADIKSSRAMNGPLLTKPPVKTSSVDSISVGSQGKKTTTRISIKLHSHSIDTAADRDCSKDPVRKFTLHTTNLPQPEYAVPVSVRTTRMELKNVKQSLNNSRREFLGLNDQNEPMKQQPGHNLYQAGLSKQQRNLEMVMSGRHKFEVRDLEDSLREETVVVPLSLPRLPSAFDSAAPTQNVPNGLFRQDQQLRITEMEPLKESIDEEKLLMDSTATEKGNKSRFGEEEMEISKTMASSIATTAATTADSFTMKSINTSWSIAGESMMHESQLSTTKKTNTCSQMLDLLSEEATLNAPPSLADDSAEKPNAEDTENDVTLNDVLLDFNEDEDDEEPTANEPFQSELEKYANNHNDPLLEDETSPSVSLLTSSFSKESTTAGVPPLQEVLEEDDQLEDTPEPDNIKSPTHTSHSNSLSDPGRDFLIDDEIADQPGLFSSYKNADSETVELPKAVSNDKALVKCSPLSKHRQLQIKSKLSPLFLHTSPIMKLRQVQRTESLDTLSPCDSIASDDLMMDFESQSSFESIDRMGTTLREQREQTLAQQDSAASPDHEMQLWKELEQQSGDLFREWKSILSSATATNIRNTPPTPSPPSSHANNTILPSSSTTAADAAVPTSNLPTRGTRLLNRSRVQSGLTNCPDSPRSVESIPRPRRSSSLTKTPSPMQATMTANKATMVSPPNPEDLTISRSARNTMIQDVLYFKKQLLRLRHLLQEDEDILKRTDTLNPFELLNGDISSPLDNKTSRHLSMYQSMDKANVAVGTGSGNEDEPGTWIDNNIQPTDGSNCEEDTNNNNHLANNHELMDMRRQLVYLQSQLDENSRTIRIQKNLITKYEAEKQHVQPTTMLEAATKKSQMTVATQTERIRPVSQSRVNGISSRIEHNNGHNSTTKSRSRSIGIPTANRHSNGKQPISLISGLGLDLEEANNNSNNRQRSVRTNYTENLLLQHNNNRNRLNLISSSSPPTQLQQRGQIYSKKSSMDDLLSIKHLSVSPPKFSPSAAANNNALMTSTTTTRRVPISRISLKYLRPSLASSTNSLSSVNHSIASSTSSLSDNNNSRSCLKIDGSYS